MQSLIAPCEQEKHYSRRNISTGGAGGPGIAPPRGYGGRGTQALAQQGTHPSSYGAGHGLPESGGFLGPEGCLGGSTSILGGCMQVEGWPGTCSTVVAGGREPPTTAAEPPLALCLPRDSFASISEPLNT